MFGKKDPSGDQRRLEADFREDKKTVETVFPKTAKDVLSLIYVYVRWYNYVIYIIVDSIR